MARTKRISSAKVRKPKPAIQPKRRWLAQAVAVAILPGVLCGIVLLGQFAREQIETRPRYKASFSEITCTPLPGMKQADFLSEVQYNAELPDRLALLDPMLPQRLASAFAMHPWVEKVERVTIDPPRQVHIELVYRRPVLAVRWQDALRAVDAHGVLLPTSAATAQLPVYGGKVLPPAGPTGSKWGDPALEEAARTAAGKE